MAKKTTREEYRVLIQLNRFGDPEIIGDGEYPEWVHRTLKELDKTLKAEPTKLQ